MIDSLPEWHAECNRRTAAAEAGRTRQFGLHPVHEETPASTATKRLELPGEVWAWQQVGAGMPTDVIPVVRVGFAGSRLHLGHIGLARTAAQLASNGTRVLLFDATATGNSMTEGFRNALHTYATGTVNVQEIDDIAALHRIQHQALAGMRLEKLRRLYGWGESARASAVADVAAMLGFFLYDPHDDAAPGVALVDSMQAPHSALLSRAARDTGRKPPTLMYRRLFPSLRQVGKRGSVRESSSVVFADDDEPTVRRKFMGSLTGGRVSADQQRQHGGEPARCPVFSMIELLRPAEVAERALMKCQTGQVLCGDCKGEHADAVAATVMGLTSTPVRAGQSPAVRDAVAQAAEDLYKPPPRDASHLEAAIAADTGGRPEQVVVGHGSTEVMDWAFGLQTRPGARVVATEPTFELYRDLAARHGLEYVAVPWQEERFSHDVGSLLDAIDDDTALCVLDVPHTVSGAAGEPTDLVDQVARALPDGALLLLDMVYADFAQDPQPSAADLLREHSNIVICRSFSKAHCLLGARVGYGITTAARAERLRDRRLPYAMDTTALTAAETSLRDRESLRRTVSASHQARERVTDLLRKLSIPYAPTEANFLLMNLGRWFEPVAELLRARGARFRDGRRWGMPGWMQVHLIELEQVEPFVSALQQVNRGGTRILADPPPAPTTHLKGDSTS
ncbi:pyridoxal phosphate-dependent aminotransferase [Myceligenerans cantabricum]